MSECIDNQEVGLEAATLERVRNSSLVKCSGAENVTGLKPVSEAMNSRSLRGTRVVEERSHYYEAGAKANPWSCGKRECRHK
jgi:hypothetical protein